MLSMNAYFDAPYSDLRLATESGFTGHLMVVSYFVQRKIMDRLLATGEYRTLNLSHEAYIASLAERDRSPGEIAEKLGVSKQTCSKAIRELEKLGLIERRKNPEDSRSSLLSLSASGLRLIQIGIDTAIQLEVELSEKIGKQSLESLNSMLEMLCEGLGITIPFYRPIAASDGRQVSGSLIRLNILLPLVNNYCFQALIKKLGEKGFEGLRPNFSYIMSLIVPDGGRIQLIASVVGVSKQAIAAIALELEQLGYIHREIDPQDKRQVILRLSEKGQRLLDASASSIDDLENDMKAIVGSDKFDELQATLETLFRQVVDQRGMQRTSISRIHQLSKSLLDELGPAGAQVLAQHLMDIARSEV